MKKDNVLVIDNITKIYDGNWKNNTDGHGIKSITAEIRGGEIVAVIGPNGVGKTTLVKALAGLLSLSEGEVWLSDISTSDRIVKRHIGYMQDSLEIYNRMTVYEMLDFICKVKYDGKFHEEIDIYLKKYNLFEQRNALITRLSLGMKRKLSVIMALLGTPKLIMLDEPTNGVDTQGILQLKKDLMLCSQKGSIVIVTSHVLDFLEKICSRCIFLKNGMIVQDIQLTTQEIDLENIYEEIYSSESSMVDAKARKIIL